MSPGVLCLLGLVAGGGMVGHADAHARPNLGDAGATLIPADAGRAAARTTQCISLSIILPNTSRLLGHRTLPLPPPHLPAAAAG